MKTAAYSTLTLIRNKHYTCCVKLLTYGVYVEAYVKDQIFGMYPPSRCITPERLSACASECKAPNKKGSDRLMDNHLPSSMNHPQFGVTDEHLPGETHDHYALAESDEAAKRLCPNVK